MSIGLSEQALLFGRSKSLLGILTRPASGAHSRQPAVVILNTGIVHRVGHHRMYVTLARELAASGHSVLRFDLSGIGDSRSRGEDRDPMTTFQADLADAIEMLASQGLESFVVVGLCSGADIALQYGAGDRRILGLVLLDPSIPPTLRFYADYVSQRLGRLRSWLNFARGRGRIWRDVVESIRVALTPAQFQNPTSLIDPQTRGLLQARYKAVVGRGAKLLVVLTGGPDEGRQSYREQMLDAFPDVPFGNQLLLQHFRDCDHTFTSEADRKRLNVLILTWMGSIDTGTPASAGEEQNAGTARGARGSSAA